MPRVTMEYSICSGEVRRAIADVTPKKTGASHDVPDPSRQINLVTVVYDRLDPDSRRMARQASQDLLPGVVA